MTQILQYFVCAFFKSSFWGLIFKVFVVSQMSCKNDHFILYDTCYRVLEMD